MAALGDTVIPVLAPAAGVDLYQQGAAPVLLGYVFAAGAGGTWNVRWSNGSVSTNHDGTALRVLVAPLDPTKIGRRARPSPTFGGVSPERVGVVICHDDNDLYILRMPNGMLYSLSAANIQFLDP